MDLKWIKIQVLIFENSYEENFIEAPGMKESFGSYQSFLPKNKFAIKT